MNNLNIKLHEYQKQILAKLVNTTSSRFIDLEIHGLESEHMNYHLKKIIDAGLVEKNKERYQLTNAGKDYTNLMDDEVEFIEKQPKASVLLRISRKNSEGKIENLLSRRLRQPYLGKVGRLTGKIRFGEKLEEAALRELYEETGLKAKKAVLEMVYHKMRYNEAGEYVQDNIFYCFFIANPKGAFIEKTKHQENLWLGEEDFLKTDEHDFFEGISFSANFKPNPLTFSEDDKIVIGY